MSAHRADSKLVLHKLFDFPVRKGMSPALGEPGPEVETDADPPTRRKEPVNRIHRLRAYNRIVHDDWQPVGDSECRQIFEEDLVPVMRQILDEYWTRAMKSGHRRGEYTFEDNTLTLRNEDYQYLRSNMLRREHEFRSR